MLPHPHASRRRAEAALWRAAKAEKPALRSADIPVCGFWRLSSRQFGTVNLCQFVKFV